MAAFAFHLQPLLEARAAAEREARAALLSAVRDAARERDRAAGLRSRPFPLERALAAPALFEIFGRVLARQDRACAQARERESALHDAYAAARREYGKIEALGRRAHCAYVAEAERREARALDDANLANRKSAIAASAATARDTTRLETRWKSAEI